MRKFYQESPKSALENHAVESITSLPVSATVALGAAVLPGVAPLIPGAGLGLGAVSLGETADAISRQQTGEGLLSKIQQFIGTRQRTGTASDKTMHKELTRYRNKLRDRGPDEAMSEYLERSEPVIRQFNHKLIRLLIRYLSVSAWQLIGLILHEVSSVFRKYSSVVSILIYVLPKYLGRK